MAAGTEASQSDKRRTARHERRALWRLGAWGSAAALALCAVALASQSEIGSKRLQFAFSTFGESDPATRVAAAERRARQAQAETLRLASEVRKLRADRERLNTRLASLERDVDMTGSILRQTAEKHAAPAADPPPQPLAPIIAPLSVPPLKTALASWPVMAAPPPQPIAPAAKPAEVPPPKPAAAAPAKAAEAAPHKAALESAPKSRPTVAVPMPPVRVAALPARHPAPAPVQPAFAVDLGGASSTAMLRSRWSQVKANFGPYLGNLMPVFVRDRRHGHPPYRLLVGPVPTFAMATRLCEELGNGPAGCRPTQFTGDRVAQP